MNRSAGFQPALDLPTGVRALFVHQVPQVRAKPAESRRSDARTRPPELGLRFALCLRRESSLGHTLTRARFGININPRATSMNSQTARKGMAIASMVLGIMSVTCFSVLA